MTTKDKRIEEYVCDCKDVEHIPLNQAGYCGACEGKRQPNQDKVGERIREILSKLLSDWADGNVDNSDQALLQIKEAMKVDEGEIDQVICEYRNAGKEWNSVLLAHSICDYLEGR